MFEKKILLYLFYVVFLVVLSQSSVCLTDPDDPVQVERCRRYPKKPVAPIIKGVENNWFQVVVVSVMIVTIILVLIFLYWKISRLNEKPQKGASGTRYTCKVVIE